MSWKNKVRFTGNHQFLGGYRIETALFQVIKLAFKNDRIDHHTITYKVHGFFIENPGRDSI